MIGKAWLLAIMLAVGVPMAGCTQTEPDTVPSEVLDRPATADAGINAPIDAPLAGSGGRGSLTK